MQTITWDPAGTNAAPVSAANVKISLSVDDGHTYPYVLADSTPNDGSQAVSLPMLGTTHARVKIEAVGNVFFDVSNANFAITWPFTGFLKPIDNPPALNAATAGSSVPIKFGLGGDRGLGIFAAGYPASVQISCTTGAPIGSIESTSPAGNSGLQYDPLLNQYTYVWKTQAGWSGTCRELRVLLVDGTMHTARFKLK